MEITSSVVADSHHLTLEILEDGASRSSRMFDIGTIVFGACPVLKDSRDSSRELAISALSFVLYLYFLNKLLDKSYNAFSF